MTWPTWTCTFSDGAYDLMLKKQWAVVFTWHTAWQNTRWKSPVEVTQFPQHPTPSTSELHSIGPWPTRNIYLSSRWMSTPGAIYFDDWLVQNGEHTLMYFKQQQQHLPLPQPSIAHQCSSEQRPSTGVRMHPINTNLHAASCQRDNASIHPQKQTMPCLIPPCWSRWPARA